MLTCYATTTTQTAGRPAPTAEEIIAVVARTFAVSPGALTAPGRVPEMVDARKVAIRLLARLGLGPSAIGRLVGRDHTTVWHHQHTRLSPEQRAVMSDLARTLGLPRLSAKQDARAVGPLAAAR
jgi:hypothetical protein